MIKCFLSLKSTAQTDDFKMKILNWIDKKLSVFELYMLVSLLGLLTGLAFLQVVLRNFFNSGIIWLDPLLRHMVLWILFFGAAQATRQQKHLNIDVITRILKGKAKCAASIVINLVSLIVIIILTKGAWDYVAAQYSNGTVLILGIKLWIFQIVIPFGLFLIGYRFLLHLIESVIDLIKGKSE